MAKLFSKNELPSYVSTRDSRERLDLITENVHVEYQVVRTFGKRRSGSVV